MILTGKRLEKALHSAESYQEWADAARAWDTLKRNDRWKREDRSKRYDFASIRERLDYLRRLRTHRDDDELLFTLNEGIHGNMGGMGRAALYQRSLFGTKQLVVDYVDEICSALEYLGSAEPTGISTEEKVEFFHRASHCFGRSAFMMSGAGTLFYFHLGVLKALWEQDLLPTIISGASGGALVAAIVGTRDRDQLHQLFDPDFLAMEAKREEKVLRFFSGLIPARVPTDEIGQLMERMIPDLTFQEAHEKTGIHINVPVGPAEINQTSRLLNATTSPNVFIREAVTASCAVPGIYPPVTLAAKTGDGQRKAYLPRRKWIDGSLTEDLPTKRLARLYGVNHTIVSQTNPIALPFVRDSRSESNTITGIAKHAGLNTVRDWSVALSKMLQGRLGHETVSQRLVNGYMSVVTQTYSGDINILPPRRFYNPARLLTSPSREEIMSRIRTGEKAAWPYIEMIRVQTKIGHTLERQKQRLDRSLMEQAHAHR